MEEEAGIKEVINVNDDKIVKEEIFTKDCAGRQKDLFF